MHYTKKICSWHILASGTTSLMLILSIKRVYTYSLEPFHCIDRIDKQSQCLLSLCPLLHYTENCDSSACHYFIAKGALLLFKLLRLTHLQQGYSMIVHFLYYLNRSSAIHFYLFLLRSNKCPHNLDIYPILLNHFSKNMVSKSLWDISAFIEYAAVFLPC